MRRDSWSIISAVLLTGLLGACGSSSSPSGPDVSTPTAACQSASSTLCNRWFTCDSSGATARWGSAANCANQGVGFFDCSRAACASPRTYNSSNAANCIAGLESISCNLFTTTGIPLGDFPPSCFKLCECPGGATTC